MATSFSSVRVAVPKSHLQATDTHPVTENKYGHVLTTLLHGASIDRFIAHGS
jgi:hypothetical protein